MSERPYYIGLISGTSMDGIDAALVNCEHGAQLLHSLAYPYPDELHQDLTQLISNPDSVSLQRLGNLDTAVGTCFAQAVNKLMQTSGIPPASVRAIGSHGQNVYHAPDDKNPFTMQIGNPHIIAEQTQIDVVADFRRRDMAAGGQAAPLAPLLHRELFASSDEDRAVLNLGGIANVTILSADDNQSVIGFDTGPANCLMDEWIRLKLNRPYDENGQWAASDSCSEALLESLLKDPYFLQAAPKSTGREYFHLDWLRQKAELSNYRPAQVQATLLELTVRIAANAIERYGPAVKQVFVCGGGAHNNQLIQRLGVALPQVNISSTSEAGLPPDWVEASLFGWLACQYLNNRKMDTGSITGARHPVILGSLFSA